MGVVWAIFWAVFALMSAQRNGYDWARHDDIGKVVTALMVGMGVAGAVYNLWPHIQLDIVTQ